MKPGTHHTPEARARISQRVRQAMASPDVRQKISDRTREAMADPAVRQRMKEGRRKAYEPTGELSQLKANWVAATPSVREAFLSDIMAPLLGVNK